MNLLQIVWGYIVTLLGNGGWGALWAAGASAVVVSLYLLGDLARGKWVAAKHGLLMLVGLAVPALVAWGFCRLYAHVIGREVEGWFWPAAGSLFGAAAGWAMATEERGKG